MAEADCVTPRRFGQLAAALCVAAAIACGSPVAREPATGRTLAGADRDRIGPSRVVIGIGAEVGTLASKFEAGNTFAAEFNFLSNSPLAVHDERGIVGPLLAAELPSQANGSWTVDPGGTMATTWKIRPSARWHDDVPVTAQDFSFAHRVYSDDRIAVRDRLPEQFMDRVEAVDEKTFVIYWNRPYPWANQLVARQLEALPSHVLRATYDGGDPDAFMNLGFWSSTSYVGSGPFRLVQWDPGSQLLYRAFDGYFMGRPRLDEVVFRVIPDTNTVVANVLGGTLDTTLGVTLGQQAGLTVLERWQESGEGRVLITPVRWRYVRFQFDPAWNQQPALFDVRVRRAIVHAIDRETIAQTVTKGPAADVPFMPTDPLFSVATQAVTRYPYDPTRAAALLEQAGWQRRGDNLVNASGHPLGLEIRTIQGADFELEMALMTADLAKAGLTMTQTVVPLARAREREYTSTFPGIYNVALSIDIVPILDGLTSAQCTSAERRFAGANTGCWRNAEYDQFVNLAATSLDQGARENGVVQALRVLTEEVGTFGRSYSSEYIPARKGLVGPGPRWPAQQGGTWNIHTWYWE